MLDFIGQNKIASNWLLEYPERRQDFMARLSEFSFLSATIYTGMPTGTDVGTPCENKALSLALMEESRLWIMTIEDTERVIGEKKLAFLDARRWVDKQQRKSTPEKGRPGWISATQARYADWFFCRFNQTSYPDSKTVTKWWDEIVNITVRIAIARGCVFKK